MRIVCILTLLALAELLFPARAELWTNQAGRVIAATLGDFDGKNITLIRTNGIALKLPLTALCTADQRRVRLKKAQTLVPDFVRAAYQDAVTVLKRFEALPPGQRTEEGRNGAIRMACGMFDARLKARSAEISDKEVISEINRLRDSIAKGVPPI